MFDHDHGRGGRRCAGDVGGLYEQLARERAAKAATAILAARAGGERYEEVLAQMAEALEDTAGVITLLAAGSCAVADLRDEVAREAALLVALAAGLEQAADLNTREA